MASNASYPIDVAAYLSWVRGVSDIDADINPQTGEHKTNRDGVPMWRLELLVRRPGTRRSVVDQIRFPARQAPVIDPAGDLVITNLVGRHWEQDNDYGYSSGIALSADSVSFEPAHRSNNGNEQDRTGANAA